MTQVPVLPLAIAAYGLLVAAFAAELVLLSILEARATSTASGPYSDARFHEGILQVRELDRFSKGIGSVFGIGVAFAVLLFMVNFIVAAGGAIKDLPQTFDLAEVARLTGFGAVALFVLMAITTAFTNLSHTHQAMKLVKGSSIRDGGDLAELKALTGGIRLRFVIFGLLYGILFVPLVMVLS